MDGVWRVVWFFGGWFGGWEVGGGKCDVKLKARDGAGHDLIDGRMSKKDVNPRLEGMRNLQNEL